MTKDEFSRRYRVVEQLTSGEVASCRALDAGGNPVMLHMFGDPNRTSEAVASMLADLPPAESAMVQEVIEVEGSAVAVTADIAPFTSFDAWIAASGDQQPVPPVVESGPAATNEPGAYTMLFQGLDSSSVPPPPPPEAFPAAPSAEPAAPSPVGEAPLPSDPQPEGQTEPPAPAQPATPSAAGAPEGTEAGDYTRLFLSFDPGQTLGSNPAPLSSENVTDPSSQPSERIPPPEPPGPPSPPTDTSGAYTQIMHAGDIVPRPEQAEHQRRGAPPAAQPSSPPEIRWRQPASPPSGGLSTPPAAPSPPPPPMPGADNLEGGPEDLRSPPPDPPPGPPPVKPLDDPAALAAPGSNAPDYLNRLRTPTSPRAASMPGAHSPKAGPGELEPRPPDPAPGPPPVKPVEDPAALAAPGSNAPDYLDRLRTPTSPASPGAQPPAGPPGQVAYEPPPAGPPGGPPPPNPDMAGPSDYTMVIKGFTPPAATGPAAPAPQPPPAAQAPAQPVPARRKSRVPLVIGVVVVVVAILIALVVFVVLPGVGVAADTG